jgi:GLPGLI family protein
MKTSRMTKRILLALGVLVSLASAQIVIVQATEGVINYEVKINTHRTLPKDREGMKNMMPEFRTHRHQLFFNANESLYTPVEEDEDEDIEEPNGGMRIRMQQPHSEMYFNHATASRITLREFMGKNYLMEDSLSLPAWKFGTETKKVMGYECRQASYFNEERKEKIVAWYTSQLRAFLGPEIYNTLPGAVLEVDINDGERLIMAKTLDARTLKKNEMKIPNKGTRTTPAAFRKMMDEHVERMRANGANVIIRN